MLCFIRHETDPYFNIAAEEYVLKHFEDDCFMLWRNEPCIIVGKHQNTEAEINTEYVEKNKIKVVRRLTGGGAVFHDLGNLNFTFVSTIKPGDNLVDFHKFTLPILDVLRKLNINAEFSGRNDLVIEGKKFSGNAEHVFRNRILHHGTLLFSSIMTDLVNALKVDPSKFTGKAVRSVQSRVTNISEHLQQPLSVLEFRDMIMKHVVEATQGSREYSFTDQDRLAINKLRDEKYASNEWNYGTSHNYNFSRKLKTEGGNIHIAMVIELGIIQHVRIFGDYFHIQDPVEIETALTGAKHELQELKSIISKFHLDNYFVRVSESELLSVLI